MFAAEDEVGGCILKLGARGIALTAFIRAAPSLAYREQGTREVRSPRHRKGRNAHEPEGMLLLVNTPPSPVRPSPAHTFAERRYSLAPESMRQAH